MEPITVIVLIILGVLVIPFFAAAMVLTIIGAAAKTGTNAVSDLGKALTIPALLAMLFRFQVKHEPKKEGTPVYIGFFFQKREDAQRTLDNLEFLISEYDAATVGDLNLMRGVATTDSDDKLGWTDNGLERAYLKDSGPDTYLMLPKPKDLKR